MKKFLFVAAFALMLSALALSQTAGKSTSTKAAQSSKANSGSSAEQEIMSILNQMKEARMKNDKEAYSRLRSDDFYSIGSNGSGAEVGKKVARELNTTPNGDLFLTFEMSDIRIKVYGNNTAVATYIRAHKVKTADGGTRDIQNRNLAVFVKQQGRWQMVAGSVTGIAPAESR